MYLLKRKTRKRAKGKSGERAYAIGDVHGCLQETQVLLNKIKTDNDYRATAKTYVVFLGDLIDRGPQSKGVIEFLMQFPYKFAEPLFIMGNHEEMMVRGMTNEADLLPAWLKYGGYECAQSYGVNKSELQDKDCHLIQRILRRAIPRKHVDFLSEFLDYVQFGDFLFTHAGIKPGIPLGEQSPRELRWIREPFLNHNGDLGVTVVHGHTVSAEVVVKHNRIGLDTGAYQTGRLSALCIDEDEISFLTN